MKRHHFLRDIVLAGQNVKLPKFKVNVNPTLKQ